MEELASNPIYFFYSILDYHTKEIQHLKGIVINPHGIRYTILNGFVMKHAAIRYPINYTHGYNMYIHAKKFIVLFGG